MIFLSQKFYFDFLSVKKSLVLSLVATSALLLGACVAPKNGAAVEASEKAFFQERASIIEKYSAKDKVFATLQDQIKKDDPESAEYWRWRTDQYLYGQYPEYQAIYNAYTKGKTFHQIYNLPQEKIGDKIPLPEKLPQLPEGYFTENLEGNPHTGWHDLAGDKLYITYQGELTDPYVASYDLRTRKWEGPVKAGESTLSKGDRPIDSHGRPIIEIDSQGYIHIIYGGHGGEREDGLNPHSIDTPHAGGRMLHLVSEKPHDLSKFLYVDDISPFASYTASEKMANGDIYLFTRAGTHKSPWVFYKMPNGQSRFEPPVMITWPTAQQHNPINVDTFYINPARVSATEIAISALWHECNFLEIHDKTDYGRMNVYYMKLDTTTDSIYSVKGEKLSLPITLETANQKILAFDTTQTEEIPFGTKPLVLKNNNPAVTYEALTKDYREWRVTAFENGQWKHNQPMPVNSKNQLRDADNNPIKNIASLAVLAAQQAPRQALVVYKNPQGNSIFATATSDDGQHWRVHKEHLNLAQARIQMNSISNEQGQTVAAVLNINKGGAQRLYLWHDGEFRSSH